MLIPELNFGQLAMIIRARYLLDSISYNKLKGQPFSVGELETRIEELLS
ncbi:MAG: hypothetical protein GY946_04600 [bacterium]|nr:hypothetical protein [bacterium]